MERKNIMVVYLKNGTDERCKQKDSMLASSPSPFLRSFQLSPQDQEEAQG